MGFWEISRALAIGWGVFDAGLLKAAQAERAAVTDATGFVLRRIAGPGQFEGRFQIQTFANDVLLAESDDRGFDGDVRFWFGAELNDAIECVIKCGAAIGIAGRIFFHRADEKSGGADDLAPAHGLARVAELHHQGVDIVLKEWLSTGDFYEFTGVFLYFSDDLFQRHFGARRKRVRQITPVTSKITKGEADENTGAAHASGLPLDTEENLTHVEVL